jgi:hypothetical protein
MRPLLPLALALVVAPALLEAQVPAAPPRREPLPHAAVIIGGRRFPLAADAVQLPSGKNFDHVAGAEADRTICLAFPAGARAPLLLFYDGDLGVTSAALVPAASAPYRGCPQQLGIVRLEYRRRRFDLATPPAELRRRLGPPSEQQGDTLTWEAEWEYPNDNPRFRGTTVGGYSGLKAVVRAGHLVYLNVWWVESL